MFWTPKQVARMRCNKILGHRSHEIPHSTSFMQASYSLSTEMKNNFMSNIDQLSIKGKDTLISELGYWPDFCDAKISELLFRRNAKTELELSLTLFYIDVELNRELLVKIVLHEVSNIRFHELMIDNVIDKLSISDSFVVEIEAAIGLFCHCKCKSIDVDVIASNPFTGQPVCCFD